MPIWHQLLSFFFISLAAAVYFEIVIWLKYNIPKSLKSSLDVRPIGVLAYKIS